ncbi:MAG: metal ABC transporter solute-binding protein, Zn/Mn family [Verrucomicrobiota bacterium]
MKTTSLRARRVALAALLLMAMPFARAEKISVVATTGMVADLVRGVGGDRVEVLQLMGSGVDPHQYRPTAGDASRLSKADAIFYNGLNLEARMGELFERLSNRGGRVFTVTDSIPRERLIADKTAAGIYDPHVWLDAGLWAGSVDKVVEGLSQADPAGKDIYVQNGESLRARLRELDAWLKARAGELPADRRVLVTSHDAFGYFGRSYGFKVVGLQGMSTVSEASLADVSALSDFLRQSGARAVFVETSVNPEAIRRVAENADVKIGGELFSDAMGESGDVRGGFDTGTHDGMLRHNMATIVEGLKP